MRAKAIIFIFLLYPFLLKAQIVFKTIVPQQPVVTGESFQVQYIIQGAEKVGSMKTPAFPYFRFVSGPNQYNGSVATMNGTQPLQNFVFTLEAVRPGRFIIPGAIAMINGRSVKSNDGLVEVIPKEEAAKLYDKDLSPNSDYVLRPGEDPYEKIRQNLFLKVMVDRKNCFAGEPVLATFKLYSRLESRSDIVKNPGFYGFTVYDMVNLSDKQVSTENINGKVFDVHTIRKVQLYPLQAGTFTIDEMEVKNKVEFSHSTVNKKTEQEIVEGVTGANENGTSDDNTEVFETSITTEPVVIHVKPVPLKNKPAAFNGAVGVFTIDATLAKGRLAKNEEGVFEITVSGNGNFTQLNAPEIAWPAGIEGFEPVIKDSLDKAKLPLTGSRKFRYPFIGSGPGHYELPTVSFSFLDPGHNIYKTVSTTTAPVEISDEEKQKRIPVEKRNSIVDINARASRVAGGIIILMVIIVLVYWIMHKNKPAPAAAEENTVLPSIDEILTPARNVIHTSDREFCTVLHQSIWKYLGELLGLEGSDMNKETLLAKLKQGDVDDATAIRLQKILTGCESGMFTTAALGINKDSMLMETKAALESVSRQLL